MMLRKFIVNPDVLKLVALITMTIDHVYKILIPNGPCFFIASDVLGRIAMSLFLFNVLLLFQTTKQI